MSGDAIVAEGVVMSVGRSDMHHVRVLIGESERTIIATRSGRLRAAHIRCIEGDTVEVAIGVYDTTRGRITYRGRRPAT